VREVLRVPGLVEQRPPVVEAADRLDDEHHALRHLDRGAERARRLLRPLLDVEVDVLLRLEVDAEVGQRRAQRRDHPVAGELGVPLLGAEEPRRVPRLRLVEPDAGAYPEEAVGALLPDALGGVEDGAAVARQALEIEADALVQT
jgi:hypothetical protein